MEKRRVKQDKGHAACLDRRSGTAVLNKVVRRGPSAGRPSPLADHLQRLQRQAAQQAELPLAAAHGAGCGSPDRGHGAAHAALPLELDRRAGEQRRLRP